MYSFLLRDTIYVKNQAHFMEFIKDAPNSIRLWQ